MVNLVHYQHLMVHDGFHRHKEQSLRLVLIQQWECAGVMINVGIIKCQQQRFRWQFGTILVRIYQLCCCDKGIMLLEVFQLFAKQAYIQSFDGWITRVLQIPNIVVHDHRKLIIHINLVYLGLHQP